MLCTLQCITDLRYYAAVLYIDRIVGLRPSVCPSVQYGLRIQKGIKFTRPGSVTGAPIFSSKGQRSRTGPTFFSKVKLPEIMLRTKAAGTNSRHMMSSCTLLHRIKNLQSSANNFNIFLLFLARIIPMIMCTKNSKNLLQLFTEDCKSFFIRTRCLVN